MRTRKFLKGLRFIGKGAQRKVGCHLLRDAVISVPLPGDLDSEPGVFSVAPWSWGMGWGCLWALGSGCCLTDSPLVRVPFTIVTSSSVSADLNLCLSLKVSYCSTLKCILTTFLTPLGKNSHKCWSLMLNWITFFPFFLFLSCSPCCTFCLDGSSPTPWLHLLPGWFFPHTLTAMAPCHWGLASISSP